MSINELGWIRIGRLDDAGRRALWCREGLGVIELCAGREGDDGYVRIDATNPQFAEIEDVIQRSRFAVDRIHIPGHWTARANTDDPQVLYDLIQEMASHLQALATELDALSVPPSNTLLDRIETMAQRPAQMLAHMARLLGVSEEESEAIATSGDPAVAVATKMADRCRAAMENVLAQMSAALADSEQEREQMAHTHTALAREERNLIVAALTNTNVRRMLELCGHQSTTIDDTLRKCVDEVAPHR